MAYPIGHLQQKRLMFSLFGYMLELWGYQLCANSPVSCLQKDSENEPWSLVPRGCKESAWLIRWFSIPAFDLSIYKLCYCYPAESCGIVPCSIRIIEGQGRGRVREKEVPLTGWVLPLLYGYSGRKMPFTFSRPAEQGGMDWTPSAWAFVPKAQGFLKSEHILKVLGRTAADVRFLCQLSLTHCKCWLKPGKISWTQAVVMKYRRLFMCLDGSYFAQVSGTVL